jgi:hypothetical protein
MPLVVSASLAMLLVGPAELSWQVVEECPGTHELERTIAGWIGGSGEGEPVRARGRIESSAVGYRLELAIGLGPREQQHVLQGHDCAELTELAALLIASAIDPFVLGQSSEAIDVFDHLDAIVVVPELPPVAEAPQSEPEPALPPALPEPPVIAETPRDDPPEFGPLEPVDEGETSRERPRVEGFLAVSGMGFAGLFERPSGGVELLGGLDRGALRVAFGAAGWFGGQFRSSEDSGVGGNLQAGTGVLEVCGVPTVRRGALGFPLCATGTAGAIVGTGVGVPDAATVVRPWVAAGGDVGLRWRVHRRVALRLDVGVLASLIRPVWEVSGPVVSFTTPPVMGRIRLAIELFVGRR